MRLNAAGLTVVITTGRNRIQCAEIARLAGWRGFIAELGCVIVPDRGADPIYLTGDWPADALAPGETPWEAIERLGALAALFEAFPGRLEPHAPYHLNREATHMLRGSLDLDAARALLARVRAAGRHRRQRRHPPAVDGPLGRHHRGPRVPPDAGRRAQGRGGRSRPRAPRTDARTGGRDRRLGDRRRDGRRGRARSRRRKRACATSACARRPDARDNVYATRGERGDGWAEFAAAWIAARKR